MDPRRMPLCVPATKVFNEQSLIDSYYWLLISKDSLNFIYAGEKVVTP
jgi:hypothetical protein